MTVRSIPRESIFFWCHGSRFASDWFDCTSIKGTCDEGRVYILCSCTVSRTLGLRPVPLFPTWPVNNMLTPQVTTHRIMEQVEAVTVIHRHPLPLTPLTSSDLVLRVSFTPPLLPALRVFYGLHGQMPEKDMSTRMRMSMKVLKNILVRFAGNASVDHPVSGYVLRMRSRWYII